MESFDYGCVNEMVGKSSQLPAKMLLLLGFVLNKNRCVYAFKSAVPGDPRRSPCDKCVPFD